MNKPQYIDKNGVHAFVVLPVDDYERLLKAATEDLDGSEIAKIIAEIDAGEETFPADFVHRLVDTDSKLREWRKFRNMTQTELAKAAGLTQVAITAIEKGNRSPVVETARKLAGALECDIDDIF